MLAIAILTVLFTLLALTKGAGTASAAGTIPVREKELGRGAVQIYDRGVLKLHAWQTADPLQDECFVLETDTNLVAIESPAFKKDIPVWKEYLAGLNKPLTDILICAHPSGGQWYGNARSHATENARKAITEGATKALAESLGRTFGPEFDANLAVIDAILTPGLNTVGGIEMEITEAADGYDIAIPSASLVYTHMLGADSHSILTDLESVNAFLTALESMKSHGWQLILSGHHTPETQADVDTKIAYLRRIRELAGQSTGKDDFITRVKNAYPDYAGLHYLEMTATSLFDR